MSRSVIILSAALLFPMAQLPASAQTMPWINPNVISTTSRTDVLSVVLDDDRARRAEQQGGERAASGTGTPRADGDSLPASTAGQDFSYRYSPQRMRANLSRFIERTPIEAGRAELAQMIAAQPTIMDDIRAGIAPYGLDSHDVADAYALWWMSVWLVANQRDEVPDNRTVAMVRNQARRAFATTPGFAETSDAERQEYAEALLLQAIMLGSMFEQWKNDPALSRQLAEAARQGAMASGLDLSTLTLSPNGFVPRDER